MSRKARKLVLSMCVASTMGLMAQSVSAQHKHGDTYAGWAAAFWTYTFGTPVLLPSGSHPAFDVGNVDCSIGQSGHVWFLNEIVGLAPGGQIQRSCSIPTGTGLFFPLFNTLYLNFASDPPLTAQACAQIAQAQIASLGTVTMHAVLDGKALQKNAIQLEQSAIFAVAMPEPTATQTNLALFVGFPASEFPDNVATANCDVGWYGYVEPLSAGHHVLQWSFSSSTLGPLYDIRYDLTVVPGHH